MINGMLLLWIDIVLRFWKLVLECRVLGSDSVGSYVFLRSVLFFLESELRDLLLGNESESHGVTWVHCSVLLLRSVTCDILLLVVSLCWFFLKS